jgi:high frequency lysogenization protein
MFQYSNPIGFEVVLTPIGHDFSNNITLSSHVEHQSARRVDILLAMDNQIDYSPEQHRAIALAGLLQSTQQVNLIARNGQWDTPAATTCVHSLFQLDADSVTDVYEGTRLLKPGLLHLRNLLQKKIERADVEITRYALTLLHLERKLVQQKNIMDKISQGLYAIKNEFDISDLSNMTLLSRIADVYVGTISTIPPKVQVEGNREYLSQTDNTYRVRAMLFAGIRSAVLWRQLGGTRWKLFLNRRRILRSTESLINM